METVFACMYVRYKRGWRRGRMRFFSSKEGEEIDFFYSTPSERGRDGKRGSLFVRAERHGPAHLLGDNWENLLKEEGLLVGTAGIVVGGRGDRLTRASTAPRQNADTVSYLWFQVFIAAHPSACSQ
jgi:hypothetical protein